MQRSPRSFSLPVRPASVARGFSLIELMVGIAVGVVCVLVILQLLSSWEGRKRTTLSGNDAQVIGTLGSFSLDRDLRLAGYGFGVASATVMGCTVIATNTTLPTPSVNFALQPVTITKGATPDAPDTVSVLYGNSPYVVSSQSLLGSTTETKKLKSRDGFQLGDKVVITGASPIKCQLVEITAYNLADANTLEHKAGEAYTTLAGVSKAPSFNPAGGTGTLFSSSGDVFNLGQAPVLSVWAVDPVAHVLTHYNQLADDPLTKTVAVTSDVVTLKAQYGIDADSNGVIDAGEWTDTPPAPPLTTWNQVLAVRFGLLVRARQYERPDATTPVAVTPTAPSWSGGTFALKGVDGAADAGAGAISGAGAVNNWRNYRYRVYENVVPLRNMLWGNSFPVAAP